MPAWCNLHATVRPFALVLALAALVACKKDEEPRPPTGSGVSDIFGTAPSVAPSSAPPVDAGAPATDAGAAAGGPMLHFMKGEMATAFAAKKGPLVATTYDKLAKAAPAGYANWASICRDGADAAKASDWNGVKATCRGCHAQYKEKYIAEHRAEALP